MSSGYVIMNALREYEMLDIEGVKRETGLKETEILKLIDAGIMHPPTKVETQIWYPYGLYKIEPRSAEFIRMCLKSIEH